MIHTTKKYSEEDKKRLSGQIAGTRYTPDVRKALAKHDICFDPGYIRFVVNGLKDHDSIWAAIEAVAEERELTATV